MRKKRKMYPAYERCCFDPTVVSNLPDKCCLNQIAKRLEITRQQLTKWTKQGLTFYRLDGAKGKNPSVFVKRVDLVIFLKETNRLSAVPLKPKSTWKARDRFGY